MDISNLAGNNLAIGKILIVDTKRSLIAGTKHILFGDMTTTEHGVKLTTPRPVMLRFEYGRVRIISNTITQATLITVTLASIKVLS